MSSSESSDASPSPEPSLIASFHGEPSLERLLSHFVAAKRALASSQYVERATESTNSSRKLIERIAVAESRNAFAHVKIQQQITTLDAIKDGLSTSGSEVDDDFTVVISKLDAVNNKLQKSLTALKNTIVDSMVQRTKSGDTEQEDEPAKTLYDYVDESQYETLSESLRTLIDTFQNSRRNLEQSLDLFRESIADLSQTIQVASRIPANPVLDEPAQPIPQVFDLMEEHAAEMAELLQSLVSHYDLCVSALKHTEGGREAARQAVLGSQPRLNPGDDPLEESLYEKKVAEPISEAERIEMLRVLEGDADQLDEVLQDLRDRSAEIDKLHDQLAARDESAARDTDRMREAVQSLHQIRAVLPAHIEKVSLFRATWTEVQISITEKTQEIIGLRDFYEQFLTGYKKLLREIDRRKGIETQMNQIAKKAQQDLDKLYLQDRESREDFFDEVGSFLPSDLWPGVREQGMRWEITAVQPAQDEATTEQLRRSSGDVHS